MKTFFRAWLFFASVTAAWAADYGASPQIPIDNANWTATDDLGRTLPDLAQTGPTKPNRWIGMYYEIWHSQRDHYWHDYDVTAFLKTHPNFWPWQANPPGGPANPTWYWAQPIFGYYASVDTSVIRRQLCLIADAGADFIYIDLTNNYIYEPELKNLLDAAHELKAKGLPVPRFVLFVHTNSDPNVEKLYTEWYKPGKYDDLWFHWYGKPLIMAASPADASKLKDPKLLPELQNYFTYRPAGWPDEDPAHPHTHWLYAVKDPVAECANGPDGRPEAITVCKSMGGPIWDNMQTGGVSCHPGFVPEYDAQCTSKENGQGLYMQHEFDAVQNTEAPILLFTGWNEWTAGVWEQPGVVFMNRKTKAGEGYFVDQFNMDFNRDVEPMKGGYEDNYYWQTVANFRRWKGMNAPEETTGPVSIPMNGNFSAWGKVQPVYRASVGIASARDCDGSVPGLHYKDDSARNPFASAQVTSDIDTVYFHVKMEQPLSPSTDKNWMMLLIDADAKTTTGWHGYDFLVNRERNGQECTVESNVDGAWKWQKAGTAKIDWAGNDLEIAVPRNLILGAQSDAAKIDFKWVDHIPDNPDIMDFYTVGTTAPDARFNYRYEEKQ